MPGSFVSHAVTQAEKLVAASRDSASDEVNDHGT